MKPFVPLLSLLLCAAGPASAMYRCAAPGGAVSFQDAPCPDGAGQQILHAPPKPSAAAPAVAADNRSLAERVSAGQEAIDRSSRKLQVEHKLLPDAKAALKAQHQQCDQKLAAITEQLDSAAGRHAGAQRDTLLATQESTRNDCEIKGGQLADKVETLRAECAALGCGGD